MLSGKFTFCFKITIKWKLNVVTYVPFDSDFETECKLFTQHLGLENDCCISRNVGRTKVKLVTSNN